MGQGNPVFIQHNNCFHWCRWSMENPARLTDRPLWVLRSLTTHLYDLSWDSPSEPFNLVIFAEHCILWHIAVSRRNLSRGLYIQIHTGPPSLTVFPRPPRTTITTNLSSRQLLNISSDPQQIPCWCCVLQQRDHILRIRASTAHLSMSSGESLPRFQHTITTR